MDNEKKKMLEDCEKSVKDMLADNSINEEVYFKFIVNIAYDYAMENSLSKATLLLQRITKEYIEKILPKQCEEDLEFAEVCFRLSKKYIDNGIISLERSYNFNKAPAEA